MSGSPEPPLKKKSTSGRILSATKRKLTAPVSTFVKAVRPKKKAKVADSDVASSAQGTGAASSIQERQSSPSMTSRNRVIISDEEDEDSRSHRGQTLNHDSDVIMLSDDEAEEIAAEKEAQKELGMRVHFLRLHAYRTISQQSDYQQNGPQVFTDFLILIPSSNMLMDAVLIVLFVLPLIAVIPLATFADSSTPKMPGPPAISGGML
jgi:hypothetical protein